MQLMVVCDMSESGYFDSRLALSKEFVIFGLSLHVLVIS